MKTLVTGGTGFVGSAVVRALLAREHAVRVLCRADADRTNLRGLDVEVVQGDLCDPASLKAALAGARVLFHAAADHRLWVREPDTLYQSNVTGTLDLLSAAMDAGVQRAVYTSSAAVLGSVPGGGSADEDTPSRLADMPGHYTRSKFIAEEQVRRRVRDEGWPVVIVNPSTPVGPRDIRPTPTGGLVLEAARGRLPAYVDAGINVVHVDDVANGHVLALERGEVGQRYILGGENMTLHDILAEVARLNGRSPPRLRLPRGAVVPVALVSELLCRLGAGEPLATVEGLRMARRRMYFSSDRARRSLGYGPRPAQEAIRDAVAWFRERGRL